MNQKVTILTIFNVITYVLTQSVELNNDILISLVPSITGRFSSTQLSNLNIPHTIPSGGYLTLTYPQQWDVTDNSQSRTIMDCTITQGGSATETTGQIISSSRQVKIMYQLASPDIINIICTDLKNPNSNFVNTLLLEIFDNNNILLSYKQLQPILTPATISALTLTPSSQYTSDITNLFVTFTPQNVMNIGTEIIIEFPKLNPLAPTQNQQSMLSLDSSCIGITGIDSDISCSFLNDQLRVHNAFKLTGNMNKSPISFQISNFHNPQSTQQQVGFNMYSKNPSDGGKIDQILNAGIQISFPSNLQSVEVLSSNSQIRKQTNITFQITPRNFLNQNSILQITFPRKFDLSNSTLVTSTIQIWGVQNIPIQMFAYTYTDYTFTIAGFTSSYIQDVTFIIEFRNILNYDGVQQSENSFQVKIFDSANNPVEQIISGIMYDTTPGQILNMVATFNDTLVQQLSILNIDCTLENSLTSNSKFQIIFPSNIQVPDFLYSQCPSSSLILNVSPTSFCQITANTLTISSLFPSGTSTNHNIQIQVPIVLKNPMQTIPLLPLKISSLQDDLVIDTLDYQPQFQQLTIQNLQIQSLVQQTNQQSQIQISFEIPQTMSIQDNSYIYVYLPQCLVNQQIYFQTIFSSQVSGFTIQDMIYQTGFVKGRLSNHIQGNLYSFKIEGLVNPRTTQQCEELQVQIKGVNDTGLIAKGEGQFPQMANVNQMVIARISGQQQLNTLGNYFVELVVGGVGGGIKRLEILQIQFPTIISLNNAKCKGQINQCQKGQPNTIDIVFQEDILANQLINFTIYDVQNPSVQESAFPFIFTLKNALGYLISQNIDDQGIQQFQAGNLLNPSVLVQNQSVGEITQYEITFENSLEVANLGYILVNLPQNLQIMNNKCSLETQQTTCELANASTYQLNLIQSSLQPGQNKILLDKVKNGINNQNIQQSFKIQTYTPSKKLIEQSEFFSTLTFQCQEGCDSCVSNFTNCITCMPEFILQENQCVKNCGKGYVLDGDSCKQCGQNCQICGQDLQCIVCNQGYLLSKGYECFVQTEDQLFQQQQFSGTYQNVAYISIYLIIVLVACIFTKITYRDKFIFFYAFYSFAAFIELFVTIFFLSMVSYYKMMVFIIITVASLVLIHILLQILSIRLLLNTLASDESYRMLKTKSKLAYFIHFTMLILNYKFFLMYLSGWSKDIEAHNRKFKKERIIKNQMFLLSSPCAIIRHTYEIIVVVFCILSYENGFNTFRWYIWPTDFLIYWAVMFICAVTIGIMLNKDINTLDEQYKEQLKNSAVSNSKWGKQLDLILKPFQANSASQSQSRDAIIKGLNSVDVSQINQDSNNNTQINQKKQDLSEQTQIDFKNSENKSLKGSDNARQDFQPQEYMIKQTSSQIINNKSEQEILQDIQFNDGKTQIVQHKQSYEPFDNNNTYCNYIESNTSLQSSQFLKSGRDPEHTQKKIERDPQQKLNVINEEQKDYSPVKDRENQHEIYQDQIQIEISNFNQK